MTETLEQNNRKLFQEIAHRRIADEQNAVNLLIEKILDGWQAKALDAKYDDDRPIPIFEVSLFQIKKDVYIRFFPAGKLFSDNITHIMEELNKKVYPGTIYYNDTKIDGIPAIEVFLEWSANI